MDLLTNNNENLPVGLSEAEAGQQGYTEEEVFRSMKINQESKTPYSDATQVRSCLFGAFKGTSGALKES